ncbi:uracil phosphoribosyltransferase [soil metagenome]
MFILNTENSLANHFLAEIRDTSIQTDRLRFRRNLERLGEIMAYEFSKKLSYSIQYVTTPLGESKIGLIDQQPVLIPILRAGLPFFQGFLNYFDQASCGFIGAYREPHDAENEFAIAIDYMSLPVIEGKIVVLLDPMLATGKSLIKSVNNLLATGTPNQLHIIAAIAAPEGIKNLEMNLSFPYSLYVGAIDEKLNSKAYIVPGLGDAGDLCYGSKI